MKSNPDILDEAFWKIKGLYIYERKNIFMQKLNDISKDNSN